MGKIEIQPGLGEPGICEKNIVRNHEAWGISVLECLRLFFIADIENGACV